MKSFLSVFLTLAHTHFHTHYNIFTFFIFCFFYNKEKKNNALLYMLPSKIPDNFKYKISKQGLKLTQKEKKCKRKTKKNYISFKSLSLPDNIVITINIQLDLFFKNPFFLISIVVSQVNFWHNVSLNSKHFEILIVLFWRCNKVRFFRY